MDYSIKQQLLERFLRYVKIDTQSQDESTTFPSTLKQFDLAKILEVELKKIGAQEVSVDEYCYVWATLPASNHPGCSSKPTVGLIAHLDTAAGASGANVKPRVIENYQGGDIVLGNSGISITVEETPVIQSLCLGHTLVVTDGTTLLGGDDKAGIAEIMTTIDYLIKHPEIPHGKIRICFTPDEEVGNGALHFDTKKAGMDFAYTVDGELPGSLNKETFSANNAKIIVTGKDIHPKDAKNVMVNAIRIMSDIIAKMPLSMAPETTDGHQPYIHPHTLEGSVSHATLSILLRDFKTEGLDEQKKILERIIDDVKLRYPKAHISLEIKESYRNMLDILEKSPQVLKNIWDAATIAGANPRWEPIRGGTDGARLSAKGIPTPNIFIGGHNAHSVTEFVSVDFMEMTVKTLLNLVKLI